MDCEEKYLDKKICRDHMKEKHGIGNYCDLCNEYFLSKDGLERHMKSHVTENKDEENLEGIECKQCCGTFETEEEFIEHEDYKECDQCKKWFCSGIGMSTHKKRFCEITNKNEKQDDNKVTQLNTIETQMNHSREDSSQKDETRKELEEAKTIECATCNEKYGSIEKLIKHVMEIECVKCNKNASR